MVSVVGFEPTVIPGPKPGAIGQTKRHRDKLNTLLKNVCNKMHFHKYTLLPLGFYTFLFSPETYHPLSRPHYSLFYSADRLALPITLYYTNKKP